MTIPTDYTSLKTEIANWLNRTDLTSDIPTFIQYAESTLNRLGVLDSQETTAAITMTSGQAYSTLPSGFIEHIDLIYDNSLYAPMEKVDIKDIDENGDQQISSGVPQFFAISNGKYYWDIMPDSAYSLTARYYKKWDIASDDTNSILTNYPDFYVYGALAHAGKFINHPSKDDWAAMALDALGQIQYASQRTKKIDLSVDVGIRQYNRHNNIYTGR